ncbi:bestrophin family protein [Roseibium sp. M-1]
MIVRDPPNHLRLFFIMQGSIVPRIAPLIAIVAGFTLLVSVVDRLVVPVPHISLAATGVFGIALSLFLGFRNNAAYERWWEARKLWGQLVADMRSLGRETDLFLTDAVSRRHLYGLAIAFAHLHRANLRGVSASTEIERWREHVPVSAASISTRVAALDAATRVLIDARANDKLDGFGQKALSERFASISLAQAGCERIRNTPLPFVYSLLVLRTSWLYCLAIPFALIDGTGWMAPLFAAIIAYVFFGLSAVTEELEHPFYSTAHGLPLDALCRTIEIVFAERLGEPKLEPLKPLDGVLT